MMRDSRLLRLAAAGLMVGFLAGPLAGVGLFAGAEAWNGGGPWAWAGAAAGISGALAVGQWALRLALGEVDGDCGVRDGRCGFCRPAGGGSGER